MDRSSAFTRPSRKSTGRSPPLSALGAFDSRFDPGGNVGESFKKVSVPASGATRREKACFGGESARTGYGTFFPEFSPPLLPRRRFLLRSACGLLDERPRPGNPLHEVGREAVPRRQILGRVDRYPHCPLLGLPGKRLERQVQAS